MRNITKTSVHLPTHSDKPPISNLPLFRQPRQNPVPHPCRLLSLITMPNHKCDGLLLIVLWLTQGSIDGLAPPYYGLDRPAFDHQLPPLEYKLNELEPYIDEETVKVHYNGHHAAYTAKMNTALKEWRKFNKQASRASLIDILRNTSRIPLKWREAIKNNGGGYLNHNLYWSVMSPNPDKEKRVPTGALDKEIAKKWASYSEFKEEFTNAATNVFGSGYVWLCRNNSIEPELTIVTTANQDSPLNLGLQPLMVIDVWEHAYYLKHRNVRGNYVSNWWYLLDWGNVARLDRWWKGIKAHDEL